MEYEEKLQRMTFEQLIYERAILLKQQITISKQLKAFDEECKRRLGDKCLGT